MLNLLFVYDIFIISCLCVYDNFILYSITVVLNSWLKYLKYSLLQRYK